MSEKVTFKELIDSISSQTDHSKKFTHDFLKDLVSVINSSLEKDGKVNIAGFGKFELRQMDQREGYNPQTQEKITIPEHNKVVFKPYKDLRELVNAPYLHMESEVLDNEKSEFALAADHERVPGHTEKETKGKTDDLESGSASGEPNDELPSVADRPTLPRAEKGNRALPKSAVAAAAIILIVLMGAWFLMTRPGNDESTTPLATVQQPRQNEAVQETNSVTPGTSSSNESSGQTSPATPSSTPSPTPQDTPQSSYTQEDPLQLTISEGQSLWSIASNNYRDPYLWPWIYDANKDSIANPNLIVAGKTLSIPMPDEPNLGLSSTDSLEVALGYVATYHWFKENQNEDAKFYLWAAKLFDQDVFNNVSQTIDEEDLAFANGVR